MTNSSTLTVVPHRAGFVTVFKDRSLEAVCFRTGMHALHTQTVELSRPPTYRYPWVFSMTAMAARAISSQGCDQAIISASVIFLNILESQTIFVLDPEFHQGFDMKKIDVLFVLLEGVCCSTVRRYPKSSCMFVQGQAGRHEAGEQIFVLKPGARMQFVMDGHSHRSSLGFSEKGELLFEGDHEFAS